MSDLVGTDSEANPPSVLSVRRQVEARELTVQIKRFARAGWSLVGLGAIAAIPGLIGLITEGLSGLNELGDYLSGSTGVLWSLAALLFIYVAFLGQKQQLIYQQQELDETRAELTGQRKALQQQSETLKKQRFESTFFGMLSLHNEIIDNLLFPRGGGLEVKGRRYFRYAYDALVTRYNHEAEADLTRVRQKRQEGPTPKQRLFFDRVHLGFQEEYGADLSHYFRNLYHVVRYVHVADLSAHDRHGYVRIVRAQLSAHELVLLMYNSMVDGLGHPKFRYLIEPYDLLDNLDMTLVLNSEHWAWFEGSRVEVDPFDATEH